MKREKNNNFHTIFAFYSDYVVHIYSVAAFFVLCLLYKYCFNLLLANNTFCTTKTYWYIIFHAIVLCFVQCKHMEGFDIMLFFGLFYKSVLWHIFYYYDN